MMREPFSNNQQENLTDEQRYYQLKDQLVMLRPVRFNGILLVDSSVERNEVFEKQQQELRDKKQAVLTRYESKDPSLEYERSRLLLEILDIDAELLSNQESEKSLQREFGRYLAIQEEIKSNPWVREQMRLKYTSVPEQFYKGRITATEREWIERRIDSDVEGLLYRIIYHYQPSTF